MRVGVMGSPTMLGDTSQQSTDLLTGIENFQKAMKKKNEEKRKPDKTATAEDRDIEIRLSVRRDRSEYFVLSANGICTENKRQVPGGEQRR